MDQGGEISVFFVVQGNAGVQSPVTPKWVRGQNLRLAAADKSDVWIAHGNMAGGIVKS